MRQRIGRDVSEAPPVEAAPLLRGPRFVTLAEAPERRDGEAAARRGRELLHLVEMLSHCLRLRDATRSERRQWAAEIEEAHRLLEALYHEGLPRDFPARTLALRSHLRQRG